MRVVVVGTGLMGERRVRAALAAGDEIVAVADANKIPTWASGYRRCRVDDLPPADVVVVCTPPSSHEEIAARALENGSHVFVEKPLTTDPAAAYRLRGIARERGRVLRCGLNLRFHPGVRALRQKIAGADVSSVVIYYGSARGPGFEQTWRADPKIAGGGVLTDQGVHMLDLVNWFAPDFVPVGGSRDGEAEMSATVSLGRRVGIDTLLSPRSHGYIYLSWEWHARFSMIVNGEHQMHGLGDKYGPTLVNGVEIHSDRPTVWLAEWRDFKRELLGELHDGTDGVRAVELLTRARQLAGG